MGTGLFSPTHLIILFLVALLLFGAKRLPEIGRGLGVGMREFKDSVTGTDTKVEAHSELPPPAAAPVPPVPQDAAPAAAPPAPEQRETETVS